MPDPVINGLTAIRAKIMGHCMYNSAKGQKNRNSFRWFAPQTGRLTYSATTYNYNLSTFLSTLCFFLDNKTSNTFYRQIGIYYPLCNIKNF